MNSLTAAIAVVIAVVVGQQAKTFLPRPSSQQTSLRKAVAVDFGNTKLTVLVVLQKGCPYCVDSMPFYRELMTLATGRSSAFQVVAIAPVRDKDIAPYLRGFGFEPHRIAYDELRGLPVRVTPTLLLANEGGELINAWHGRLSAHDEQEVLQRLSAP